MPPPRSRAPARSPSARAETPGSADDRGRYCRARFRQACAAIRRLSSRSMAHRPAASSRKCGGSPGSTAARTRSPGSGQRGVPFRALPSMPISQPMQQLWRHAPAVAKRLSNTRGIHFRHAGFSLPCIYRRSTKMPCLATPVCDTIYSVQKERHCGSIVSGQQNHRVRETRGRPLHGTSRAHAVPSALEGDNAPVHTVHRLDAAVSGVMVTSPARATPPPTLARAIEKRGDVQRISRRRHGALPEQRAASCAICCGATGDCAKRFSPKRRGEGDVREARLAYEVLASRAGLSPCRIRLYTGRAHQIRCQASPARRSGRRKIRRQREGAYRAFFLRSPFRTRSPAMLTFAKKPPAAYPWTEFPGEVL